MRAMLLLLAAGFGFVPAQPAPTPVAAPPATDIYLVPLSAGLASMKAAKPVAISVAPGYDAAFQLGAVSRLTVSPNGDAVAVVVAEPRGH